MKPIVGMDSAARRSLCHRRVNHDSLSPSSKAVPYHIIVILNKADMKDDEEHQKLVRSVQDEARSMRSEQDQREEIWETLRELFI